MEHADLSGDRTVYRSSMTSLYDGEQLFLLVEPTDLVYGAERRDDDELPHGHSHETSQYTGTASERVSFRLEYRRDILQHLYGWDRDQAIEQMEEFRRFTRAHLATAEYPDGIIGGEPSPIHLHLPGRLGLRVDLLATQYGQPEVDDIDMLGQLRRFTVELRFREAPISRMTAQWLRQVGYRRW